MSVKEITGKPISGLSLESPIVDGDEILNGELITGTLSVADYTAAGGNLSWTDSTLQEVLELLADEIDPIV